MKKQEASEYRGYRTAGIRLTEELLPALAGTESSEATMYAIHRFDKAHVVMLVEEGLMSDSHGAAILRVLRGLESSGDPVAERVSAGGGTHSGEQILIRQLGEEIGGQIHLGRSSGDLVAVSSSIYWRDQLLALVEAISRYRSVLFDIAKDHLATVMPGYTHGQSAQPTTYGHQLLAWTEALRRDGERAREAYSRINVSPAGAAIMTGTNFPINRERTAELLGFSRPSRNTFDSILQHDDALEIANLLALHSYNMARFADDLMFWSAAEINMIQIPDRYCGTSSIMPQKRNAYAPEHIKGTYGAAVGGLMTGFMLEKGPTGTPILDRIFYFESAVHRQLDLVLRNLDWMTQMSPDLIVDGNQMLKLADSYWAQATDIVAALVTDCGLNWRTAHQIVGILVRTAEERNLRPDAITSELIDEAAIEYFGEAVGLSQEALKSAVDSTHFVASRTLYGGPSPDSVRSQWQDYVGSLEADVEWAAEQRSRQQSAARGLEDSIDRILA